MAGKNLTLSLEFIAGMLVMLELLRRALGLIRTQKSRRTVNQHAPGPPRIKCGAGFLGIMLYL
jgi:hypothetical protein